MKIKKTSIVTLLCCHLFGGLMAQSMSDQPTFKNKFSEMVTGEYQEKVFLHIDKPYYFTGENLWFKSYCVDASLHTLSSLSKVLYVELINRKGQSLMKKRVQSKEGKGKGQFFINQDIPSGIYYIRAYTALMKNFDHAFFFEKMVSIINPFMSLEPIDTLTSIRGCSFFPEGGDLVYGVESKVAYQVVDSLGQGIEASLTVLDDEGTEVLKTKTAHNGIGVFRLHPEVSKIYKAVVDDGMNPPYSVQLPTPSVSGFTMEVNHLTEDELVIVNVHSKNVADNEVFLMMHARGIEVFSRAKSIKKGETQFLIPSEQVMNGINHITLFNSALLPVCERLIFKYPEDREGLSISPNKSTYSNREKVTLKIGNDKKVLSQTANLSLSVYQYTPKLDLENNSIETSLLLGSDLKGHIESPDYYFSNVKDDTKQHLDNLLLTHGWRRFLWKDVLEGNFVTINNIPEITSPVIQGTVEREGLNGHSLNIIFPGKSPELLTAHVDEQGNFFAEVPQGISNEEMLFHSEEFKITDIKLKPWFVSSGGQRIYKEVPIDTDMTSFIENYAIHTQIANVYQAKNKVRGVGISRKNHNIPFYGSEDFSYQLDDYTRFTTMDDLFVEYIRYIKRKRKQGERNLYVWDFYANLNSPANSIFFDDPALVMIDGIPVEELDFIFDFDPLKVEKIDIVARRFLARRQQFSGIVNFITYNGDFGDQPLPAGIVKKLYHGLEQPREFYAPKYDKNEKSKARLPDYRKVLHWKPNIQLNNTEASEIEFYTSDDHGTYRIEVNGISENGDPLYGKTEFTVKPLSK
ncbi:hypothetical protein QQ008_02955 [Fulvivirgaceae bacterium BMA10]|uniref:Macroglobulin domain-containing protein n=1 Tax=Splendidivirga corallicola TaxID=3051826 RepID=A0ABT8KJ58_9BACT|nr:hypothetical protein [Fulvivirgaceae bacterium BMA10]